MPVSFHAHTSWFRDPWKSSALDRIPESILRDQAKIVAVYSKHCEDGFRHLYVFERNVAAEISADNVWLK